VTELRELPPLIKAAPHWRINSRVEEYKGDRIPTLPDCLDVIRKTKVRLRGWDYPHLSVHREFLGYGSDFIASGTDFDRHREYWRLYQSGQFIHLFGIWEADQSEWSDRLRAMVIRRGDHLTQDDVPGVMSIINFIWTITEIYEFMSRLSQHEVYNGLVWVSIELNNIAGFFLTLDDPRRTWFTNYRILENHLTREHSIQSEDLIARGPEHAFQTIRWFFERFGWFEMNEEMIRQDQLRLLEGRL
jgi:hypothetical protein